MSLSKTRLVSGVSGRYGLAFFELMGEEKSTKGVMNEVASLQKALPALEGFLCAATAGNAEKEEVLKQVAKKLKLSKLFTNFICLVARKGRGAFLEAILKDIQTLEARKNGVVQVRVQSATKLTTAQQKQIEAFVKQIDATAKTVEMRVDVEKNLLAGFKVQVGAQAYDNSLLARFEGLKQSLKARPAT